MTSIIDEAWQLLEELKAKMANSSMTVINTLLNNY